MWYSLNDLLSKNRLLSYVIGNRGGGKTFSAQMWAIKDAIKNVDNEECKHKFIWLRRYETEITQIKNNWCSKDLRDKFSKSNRLLLLNYSQENILNKFYKLMSGDNNI